MNLHPPAPAPDVAEAPLHVRFAAEMLAVSTARPARVPRPAKAIGGQADRARDKRRRQAQQAARRLQRARA